MAGKSSMNFFVIILVILIIDVVGGYFIGKKLLVPMAYESRQSVMETSSSDSEEGKSSAEEPGSPHQLEPINLNPKDSAGEVFSCTLTLSVADEVVIEELKSRDPQIIDLILNYLSAKTIPELSDVEKREEYRKEIIQKLNSILLEGNVTNLYITQWIIQ